MVGGHLREPEYGTKDCLAAAVVVNRMERKPLHPWPAASGRTLVLVALVKMSLDGQAVVKRQWSHQSALGVVQVLPSLQR